LDVDDGGQDARRSFPTAFVEGMAAPNRSRLLGDSCASEPSQWLWGKPEDDEVPDAVLLLYGTDVATVENVSNLERACLTEYDLRVLGCVRMQDLRQPNFEPFGFRDGVSQPVIRGSRRFHQGVNP